jgi:Fibronectin type III domain
MLTAFFVVACGVGGCRSTSPGTGTVTLTWTAPATNTDGSPLTDLAGFKVYYGTTAGYHPQAIDVGAVTTFQVANLPAGATYYFVVTAYNQARFESNPSVEWSKTIN